ncbi:hypothetical protein [Schauerella aestuarii]|uniref:hypothetical protein n=1 Tax=Schauerella aestuarii TaxID=2511204 RepID=UPI001F3BA80D|nr:hypothetical protein [Achromobacter aestuarii]
MAKPHQCIEAACGRCRAVFDHALCITCEPDDGDRCHTWHTAHRSIRSHVGSCPGFAQANKFEDFVFWQVHLRAKLSQEQGIYTRSFKRYEFHRCSASERFQRDIYIAVRTGTHKN